MKTNLGANCRPSRTISVRAGLVAAAVVALPLVLAGAPGRNAAQEQAIVRIPVTGTIELGLAPFVGRAIREAEEQGAAAIVLDIDTPGGRIDAAWEIIDDVRETDIRVLAYVNRRALSAGAMIGLAADELYMRPGSTIGAATPVDGQGVKASEKMVSAMRSEFRALAEERGFDPQLGAAMVDEAVEVPGVVEAGQLLTLTTAEAVRLSVATGEVEDYDALLRQTGLSGAATISARPNWAEGIVRFLSNPLVAPMLLSLGFLGLMIEIKTPTFGLAGAVGLASLAAFFGARYIVNLAGMEELMLLVLGVALIAAEIFLIPGVGLAGVGGALAVIASVTLSMVGSYPTMSEVISSLGFVALSILVLGVVAYALVRHLPYSRSLKGIILTESIGREGGYLAGQPRQERVGEVGVTTTALRPSGTARFGEEHVDVMTEGPFLDAGATVKIVRVDGYRYVVRKAPSDDGTSSASDDEPIQKATTL